MNAYSLGYQDCLDNCDLYDNPYALGTREHDSWVVGWEDAADEFSSYKELQFFELLSGRFI